MPQHSTISYNTRSGTENLPPFQGLIGMTTPCHLSLCRPWLIHGTAATIRIFCTKQTILSLASPATVTASNLFLATFSPSHDTQRMKTSIRSVSGNRSIIEYGAPSVVTIISDPGDCIHVTPTTTTPITCHLGDTISRS